MTDLGKVLDLIKKLMAKADSAHAIGSIEEAAAFAAKASELLLKHKLEMSDVELAAQDSEDGIADDYLDVAKVAGLKKGGGKRRAAWIERLVHGLCLAHFCRLVVVPGSKIVRIVGRKSDRDIVVYLITTLVREGERMAILYERVARVGAERAGLPIPEQPKRGFLLGFTAAINERLRELRKVVVEQGGQFAVIRFQQAEAAVTKYWDDNVKKQVRSGGSGPSSSTDNKAAWEAGRKAGKSVPLHGGLGGGSQAGNGGTIGRASQLLGGGK